MCWALVAAAAAAQDASLPVEIVRLDADQVKKVAIVSQQASEDGRELTIVLEPKDDRFTADFELPAVDYRRLKLVVLGAKKADTIRYFPSFKRGLFVDLDSMRGVSVDRDGKDCVIEFLSQKAIAVLAPRGRLLFRCEYIPPADRRK
jgi:hypothetical protein